MQTFWTVDTEDDTCGTTTIIDFFDGQFHMTYKGENCRYKSWGFLHQIEPAYVWACNAEYDLINLFGADWLGKLCTLQYVKAGFMRGCFREAKITFFDTYRHWKSSVKQMGEMIGSQADTAQTAPVERDREAPEFCPCRPPRITAR